MRFAGLLILATLMVGCTRAHYRRSADREVYPIVAERSHDTGNFADRLTLEPHSGSRLADPTNPDRPPAPPDDPGAAPHMHHPNGMKGAHWPKKHLPWIESPGWEATLPWGQNGKVKLNAEQAFELALLHSREYQNALENLYLSALALTLNRFEFNTRWFLTNATDFTSLGVSTPAETNTLTSQSNIGFQQTLAAGGQLIVDFANDFVLEYTANGRTSINSSFVVNFIQPLLRNAGRRVRLEQLTQAERDVLYAAREFYRFRKQFWATVTTLDGGFLAILLQVQTLRNAQANLIGQEQNLREHEALLPGGKITTVQVDQAFQAFQQGRANVAQAEAALQTSLDQFKILIGLPPRIPIELDDSVLNPFVLVDAKLEKHRESIDLFQKARYRDLDAPPPLDELRKQFSEFGVIAEATRPHIEAVALELMGWGKKLDPSDADEARRARATYEQFQSTIPDMFRELERIANESKSSAGNLVEAKRKEEWEELVGFSRRLLTLADELIAIQTQVRINKIALPPIEWKEQQALEFAKANRLDLLTAQAQVTDAWRKVYVAANALRAGLDLVASMNQGTNGNSVNFLDFARDEARYAVGVRIDGPLNRQAERNAYRAALITYQQARRGYMFLSDIVEQSIRNDLRQLELQRLNFEIARLTLISATRQLEAARQRLLLGRDAAGGSGTLDVLNAFAAQLSARNALANGYINYEQLRVQLLLDLEALQLDPHGYPVDERRSHSSDQFAADRCADAAGNIPTLPPPKPAARLAGPKE